MWVPLIENNEHLSAGADFFVEKNIRQLFGQDKNIDTIILGCTHYPLLLPKIKKFVPKDIKLVAQGEIVAQSLADYLLRHPEIEQTCSRNGQCTFLTTESEEKFGATARIFLQKNIQVRHIHLQ